MGKVKWQGVEPVYRTVIGAALATFRLMDWQIRVDGAEHIPARGPAVIASNHVGYLDFIFVGYGARERGRPVRFVAKQEVFQHPIAGPLMRAMQHIPVDRYGRSHDAIEESVRRLRRGQVVGMFPEGTISPSFVTRPGKSGAAHMAMAASAPLIPAAVWGSQRIVTKWRPRNLQRHVAIDVRFGPPVDYDQREEASEVTRRAMSAIGALVEKAAADYPQQPGGPDDRWWLPAYLGGDAPTPEQAEARLARQHAQLAQRRRERGH